MQIGVDRILQMLVDTCHLSAFRNVLKIGFECQVSFWEVDGDTYLVFQCDRQYFVNSMHLKNTECFWNPFNSGFVNTCFELKCIL